MVLHGTLVTVTHETHEGSSTEVWEPSVKSFLGMGHSHADSDRGSWWMFCVSSLSLLVQFGSGKSICTPRLVVQPVCSKVLEDRRAKVAEILQ